MVSVANPFGVGGSGGGVLAPWWSFHTLVVGAAVADGIELGAAVAVGVDDGAYVSVVGA